MSNVSMNVPETVVKEIVEGQIAAKVIEALKGRDDLIAGIVSQVLNTKVDSNGRPSCSSYDVSLLEHLCRNAIKGAAQLAVASFVDQNQKKIQAEFERQLKKDCKPLVKAFIDGMTSTVNHAWNFKVEIKPQP